MNAQSYGVLAGGCYRDLYAPGGNYTSGYGITAGLFMPFYVNDRFVVRTEAGIMAVQGRPGPEASGSGQRSTTGTLALMGRYYLKRTICLGIGMQGLRSFQEPAPLQFEQGEAGPSRSDISLLMGLTYRFTDHLEVGIRYGQGLSPIVEVPVYGTAHQRYSFLTTSYLIHNKRVGFTERRKWNSGLSKTSRY